MINIEEFKAETVQSMLEFLYSGDYSVSPRIDSSLHDSMKALDSSLECKSRLYRTECRRKSC